ncbi:phenylalanine--tRNA ligase subunit alpha [Parachitinimonas caeni]|uniref:phenylalanine--tRNA ligase subunit alpha n=1 Tax=Parachitinimonas caeni TaxID=3031301 RepID=UPI0027E537C2|nr:phenylalanine--tRNA ligase subunit alpha [Parachitinimonas caeni]
MKTISLILEEGLKGICSANDYASLDVMKAKYLGKSSELTGLLKQLGSMSVEEKKAFGAEVNQAKQVLESAILAQRECIAKRELSERLASEQLDVGMPGRGKGLGGLHPVLLARQRIQDIFKSVGFEIADGPEVESDFHNFEALNIPKNHPARAMQDTFYVENGAWGNGMVLRTHTSPIQIRYMLNNPVPIKIIAPGRVYRVDSDATHSPMFHQMEGLWVDSDVSFSDLKATLIDFLRVFFEKPDLKVRFRPSFFPFTEPSAEVDVLGENGWLEVGGCGMVHPNVLRNVGIDPEKYTGFAFGIGIDRFAMLYYGVDDLRLFFENDLAFLRQFQ